MFDLHYLTFWGIIIIAIGTIIGTILIQRGNVLKSKESSSKLQEQLKKQDTKIGQLNTSNIQIEKQNEHLTKLNEQQSEVLEAQNILLKEHRQSLKNQTDFLNNVEWTNSFSDYVQYLNVKDSYLDEIYWMDSKGFSKEYFLQLNNLKIDELEVKSRKANYSISQTKMVILNKELRELWTSRGFATYNYFEYFFKLKDGSFFEENGIKIKVDNNFKSLKYDALQKFLKELDGKIFTEVLKIKEKYRINL